MKLQLCCKCYVKNRIYFICAYSLACILFLFLSYFVSSSLTWLQNNHQRVIAITLDFFKKHFVYLSTRFVNCLFRSPFFTYFYFIWILFLQRSVLSICANFVVAISTMQRAILDLCGRSRLSEYLIGHKFSSSCHNVKSYTKAKYLHGRYTIFCDV